MNKYFLCGGETTKCFAQVFIPKQTDENSLKTLFPREREEEEGAERKKARRGIIFISRSYLGVLIKTSLYTHAREAIYAW